VKTRNTGDIDLKREEFQSLGIAYKPVPAGEPMKSCLLILQRHFYSFEKLIREALESKGYSVVVANDEYPEGTFGKILGKLQIPLVFRFTYDTLTKRFLNNRKYNLALIIHGRGISERLIKQIYRSADRIVGYNWDSFQLNRAPLKWYRLVTKYYTFDYRDADRWSLPVVELFSSSANVTEKKELKYQLSAVVRIHSNRLAYIDRVVSILKPENVFISLYELHWITFAINLLKSPRLYFKYLRFISFRPLPYSKYAEVMRSSEFTIDCAHETQTGITMRCFEAINMKTKIITNNPYMRRSSHFDDADYIVFGDSDSTETLVDAHVRCQAKPYASVPRTISHFIDELVSE